MEIEMDLEEQQLFSANEVAKIIGKTQMGMSSAIQRRSKSLPPGMKKKGRFWMWPRADIEAYVRGELDDEKAEPKKKPAKVGRPRSTPASLQAQMVKGGYNA